MWRGLDACRRAIVDSAFGLYRKSKFAARVRMEKRERMALLAMALPWLCVLPMPSLCRLIEWAALAPPCARIIT